jgi:hypothetical protein
MKFKNEIEDTSIKTQELRHKYQDTCIKTREF